METAPEVGTYAEPLDELWPTLQRAGWRGCGQWARYLVPELGVLVAVRVRPRDMRREVVVAVDEALDDAAWEARAGAVLTLLPGRWETDRTAEPPRGRAVRLVQLFPGERTVGEMARRGELRLL